MDEKRKPTKKGGAVLAVLLILLSVLYVASAGPALALVTRGTIPRKPYYFVYAPVERAVGVSWRSRELLGDYQEWCGAEFHYIQGCDSNQKFRMRPKIPISD